MVRSQWPLMPGAQSTFSPPLGYTLVFDFQKELVEMFGDIDLEIILSWIKFWPFFGHLSKEMVDVPCNVFKGTLQVKFIHCIIPSIENKVAVHDTNSKRTPRVSVMVL